MDAVEKLERLEDRKEEFLEKYGEFSDLKEDLKEDNQRGYAYAP